ncbi:hypothetical protein BROOK1789C_445 [Bathymodiolus brooksi thiotrophic gill symbiont]|nr:hypothetical protein BROOK1789C_445 [Bathymodiolus brooksi thiotrophic gill symbiont]
MLLINLVYKFGEYNLLSKQSIELSSHQLKILIVKISFKQGDLCINNKLVSA